MWNLVLQKETSNKLCLNVCSGVKYHKKGIYYIKVHVPQGT